VSAILVDEEVESIRCLHIRRLCVTASTNAAVLSVRVVFAMLFQRCDTDEYDEMFVSINNYVIKTCTHFQTHDTKCVRDPINNHNM
jgi:hypothetical protein